MCFFPKIASSKNLLCYSFSYYQNMSYSKVKSFRPCSPSTSDHESTSANKSTATSNDTKDLSNNSPVPNANNRHAAKDTLLRKKSDGSMSDGSSYSLAGGKLTEAPGRLTPTGPGRIKAPPVCIDGALKRVASTVSAVMVVHSFQLFWQILIICVLL